jgi:hypothetical protein
VSKKERARAYMDFLAAEGYRPQMDEDGDVIFKSEGLTFVIITEEEDEEYVSLVLPNFWSIESEEELARALKAANEVNRSIKAAKIFVRKDGKNTWAAVEMFVKSPESFNLVFERSLRALKSAVARFAELMREG